MPRYTSLPRISALAGTRPNPWQRSRSSSTCSARGPASLTCCWATSTPSARATRSAIRPPGVEKRGEARPGAERRAIRLLVDAGYVDCYRALHPEEAGYTYPSDAPWLRLDYIFSSPLLLAADGRPAPWLRGGHGRARAAGVQSSNNYVQAGNGSCGSSRSVSLPRRRTGVGEGAQQWRTS